MRKIDFVYSTREILGQLDQLAYEHYIEHSKQWQQVLDAVKGMSASAANIVHAYQDAFSSANFRGIESLPIDLDLLLPETEKPRLGDTKLSYKQLQRLTSAERAEYARNRNKGKR